MAPRKAETAVLEPETPHTNGVVYQPAPAKVRALLFDPTEETNEQYRGLHIECRMKVPMTVYFKMAAPLDVNDPNYWTTATNRHREFAAAALVSWNVVYPPDHPKAGTPIPATTDGFMEIDLDMAVAIRDAWFYTLRTPEEVTDPLGSESPSSGGEA
jgi:hypothetical protein